MIDWWMHSGLFYGLNVMMLVLTVVCIVKGGDAFEAVVLAMFGAVLYGIGRILDALDTRE